MPPPVAPLSAVYAAVTRRRRHWYGSHPEAQRRLRQPVISVGNIAVGGRHKTPLVAALARWLVERGERPAILSRGYARERPRDGVVVVRDATRVQASLAEAGDEPFMLAQILNGCAVLTCADRYAAGRLAEAHLGCTVHLLDDGFQHLAIARDVDLVLVHPQDLTSGRMLPFGPLREPPDALRAADAVIWIETAGHVTPRNTPALHFVTRHRLDAPRPLASSPRAPSSLAPPARVLGLAGIAEPLRFFEDLRKAGWELADTLAFRDHHRFSSRDLQHVAARVQETGAAAVLTTEKDGVRLDTHRTLPFPVAVVPLDVSIEPETFFAWLAERLETAVR